ncbi:hypothetical protein EZJ49_15595 [Bdellovibrio bacteriovorus]|uniref:hypothetical protein n=1 Tax=Bdellovibrio bacteriovorus TaxID=959 RepID=UPI0021D3479B|nr:hypothetical protein [Bdellovibrio bacteriovorus]UXR64492.1 hypothetical protein EZJ49_15595 [Bdellovibrio bacteriovorus]
MKLWLAAVLLLICFQPFAVQANAPVDIVFDIDWTTFYSIENTAAPDSQQRTVEGKIYRYTDHLPQVIETLLSRHPEIRISFFSGGEKSRNETLLSQVHLPDGRSLKDTAYRIFSKEHLKVLSQDETIRFSKRNKKDLAQVLPESDPARTILIDDQVEFAMKPYKAVSSLGFFNFGAEFTEPKAGEAYAPKTRAEWAQERNKALVWLHLLDEALLESKLKGTSFADEISHLWKLKSASPLSRLYGQRLLNAPRVYSCQKVFAL